MISPHAAGCGVQGIVFTCVLVGKVTRHHQPGPVQAAEILPQATAVKAAPAAHEPSLAGAAAPATGCWLQP